MNHLIKCKFGCEGGHPTAVCPRFAKPRAVALAKARTDEIAARPVKPSAKGAAKKAKRKKGKKHGT